MSQATAPVHAWYAARQAGDDDRLWSLLDPEVEFVIADGFPGNGRYRGPTEIIDDLLPTVRAGCGAIRPVPDDLRRRQEPGCDPWPVRGS